MHYLLILWALVGSAGSVAAAPLNVSIQSESAFLLNPDNGRILYEKNSSELYYPASITKVVTAIWSLKLKGDKLSDSVVVSGDALLSLTEEAKRQSSYSLPSWRLVPGVSNMGLKKGEILTYKDLLYGLMVSSAGDAANVIAEYAGGTIPQFVKGMNEWTKSIGCKNTRFENPHGLYHPNQQTCSQDMALIMREALKNPTFREIIGTVSYNKPKTNKNPATTLVQTNRMIRPGAFFNAKVIGGKTGYLSSSLNTFVVAAKDKDRTLIAVLLKAKDRTDLWKDAAKLFDTAFSQQKIETVLMKAGLQTTTLEEEAFEGPLSVFLSEDARLAYYPAEEPKVKGLIYWDAISPPISKGAKVAELRIADERGNAIKTYPLYAANEIRGTWRYTITKFYTQGSFPSLLFKWLATLFVTGSTLFIYLTRSSQKVR